jgi:hypothetical protein
LEGALGSVGYIALPEFSAIPKDASSDPRIAAVQALAQEPVSVSKPSTIDQSRTVRIDSLTVNVPPGADAKQLARAIREELASIERSERMSAVND